MKNNRLLLIPVWSLIVSCVFFSGVSTPPHPVIDSATEEATKEASEPELLAILSAPLYFLSGEYGNASLWRVEVDGATKSLVKDCCIREYAVSPTTGKLAYVTDGATLFIGNADGEETVEISLAEVGYPVELDSALAWSPDGLQLSLGGENGLWVYMLESESLLQISGTAEYTTFVRPLAYDAWSPSGSKVLIMSHRPNANVDEIGIIPIVSGEVKMASVLTGGRATWAPDGESFYISSNIYGITGILPSLMQVIDAEDGLKTTALIKSDLSGEGLGLYLEGAQVGSDNLLYYFYGKGPIDHETKTTNLSMYRSNRDGITDRVPLRTDTYFGISEILWNKEMSLAVIASAEDFPNTQAGTITILPIDGAVPAIETPFKGYGLQWGQSVE